MNKDNDLYRTKWLVIPTGHWNLSGIPRSYCKEPGETGRGN